MDTRKRSRTEATNGAFKKSKPEMDSSGIGSKSKPCTKFFSTAGCPFGESCHFLHYVPGGYNAVAHMMNLGPAPGSKNAPALPPPMSNGSGPRAVKTKICNRYNTAEGCKFGDTCNFAHGEWELGKPILPSQEDHRPMAPMPGRFARMETAIPGPAVGFGASATAKISVDASLAGAIIGKSGVHSKQISRQTGARLAIREHEDPNLKNIELEGSFEQIERASAMVRELIASLRSVGGPGRGPGGPGGPAGGRTHGTAGAPAPAMSNYKTKLCENFAKGSCTFGDRCHFAHGAAELRKQGV